MAGEDFLYFSFLTLLPCPFPGMNPALAGAKEIGTAVEMSTLGLTGSKIISDIGPNLTKVFSPTVWKSVSKPYLSIFFLLP